MDTLQEGVDTVSQRVRRPWLCFFACSFSIVLLCTLPISATVRAWTSLHRNLPQRAPAVKIQSTSPAAEVRVASTSTEALNFSPCELGLAPCISPPPPLQSPPPSPRQQSPPTSDSNGFVPDPTIVHFMVTLGFSKGQSTRAVTAVKANDSAQVYSLAQPWSLRQNTERNLAEYRAEREYLTFDAMDMDGFALKWGSDHKTSSLKECGQACLGFVPQPPFHQPCNIFVYCPKDLCFAPAQLPPGNRSGWCWLKHQEDPNNPHVNMRGKDNRGKPVDWQAGVVVRKGTQVQTDTKSARAHW